MKLAQKGKVSLLKNGNNLLRRFGIFIAFLIIVIILSCITSSFLTGENILNVIRQISFNGMVAIGMTFVIITGGIDLSVGSVLALGALFTTSMCTQENPGSLVVAILVGLAVATACGFLNGLMITKGKMAPFIATMAMMTMARGASLLFCNGRPIINLTDEFKEIGTGSLLLPIPILVFFLVIIVAYLVLYRSRFGRKVFAVGGNEAAAKASGVNIDRVKISVYMISSFLAGLSGIILAARMGAGSPIVGEGYELDAIAAAVIGGTSLSGGVGSVFGTVIGTLIIGIISNGLDILNVSSYYQDIVKGLIIVIAVLIDRKRD